MRMSVWVRVSRVLWVMPMVLVKVRLLCVLVRMLMRVLRVVAVRVAAAQVCHCRVWSEGACVVMQRGVSRCACRCLEVCEEDVGGGEGRGWSLVVVHHYMRTAASAEIKGGS